MTDRTVLRYAVCGRQVEAELDAPGLGNRLSRLFPEYEACGRAAVPPAGRPAICVRALQDGYLVESRSGAAVHCTSLGELVDSYEFAMAGALLAVCSDFVQLHASGAVIGGKAVLALGPAGAGKSSLALCWNRAGYATLGDDVVFLGSDLKAHPFKRQFKVDPRVLAAAGVDAAQTPFWEPHSAEAWYDPASGAGWADPAPVSLVVRTRHSPNGALFVTETSRAVALNTLVHSLMDTSLGSRASFDILARVIRQARAVEVSFGSAAEAARAIASLIV